MTLHAFTDGPARGNPGESGIGVVIKDEHGRVVLSLSGATGVTTNNKAEYTALLALLKAMKRMTCSRLIAHSDSELMVRQVNGEYKVKDKELRRYYQKVVRLLAAVPFEFELRYIPREQNRDADRLANVGIDTGKRIRV